jgi:hypothetical protein
MDKNPLADNQKKALDYINSNKLDSLFSELLNSAVQSNAQDPIVHMV